jgi:uncharacterized repeat protein (TIGR03806 family)
VNEAMSFGLLGRAIIVVLLTGCGGGGGSDNPAANPPANPPATPAFGLTSRPAFDLPNLLPGNGSLGTYVLADSFPNLSFADAVFLAGVPGEDRLVVIEQQGIIRVFNNEPTTAASAVILDITAVVSFGGEEGLLGLAFDPDFVVNRYFYVHYSATGPRRSVIARFTWDSLLDQADPATEKILLQIAQPYSNHNGGMLAFGPDEFLYIGMGDGGSGGDPGNNAQNPDNLLGSMLRIDVHPLISSDAYDVPADNPFIGQAGFRPETYAYGLRNPFRFSFDRQTGELWLGDVGQGALEEIDLIAAGENYGWRVYEGSQLFDDSANTLPLSAFTPPVVEYDHGQGVAVIGGYVYRGSRLAALQGKYIYTDWTAGPVWALSMQSGVVIANDVIASTGTLSPSFGEGNDGELYLLVGNAIQHLEETSPGTGAEQPADLLSATGVFDSLIDLQVTSGFIEYDVNQPFWSDNTVKRRWVAMPEPGEIEFSAGDAWDFPLGTVIIKHFEITLIEGDPASQRRLETRLLILTATGWQGFTYRWNTQQTDANLLSGREQESITVQLASGSSREQIYEYPSRTDCLVCHTAVAGRALGLRTRQLNRDFAYPATTDNQLRSWNNISLFSNDIGSPDNFERYDALGDDAAPLAARVRAYLDINCAYCHQPGGPTPVAIDLRYATILADTAMLDVVPSVGDLGLVDARIIAAGDRTRSVLWERMQRLDAQRMPPLGSHLVDEQALEIIGDWIDTL